MDLEAEALVHTLTDTLSEAEDETLRDKVLDL